MRPAPDRPYLPPGTRVVTTGGRRPGRPAVVVRNNGAELYLRILMPGGCTYANVVRAFVRAVPHREGIAR